jgi:hypothetical protein
MIDASMSQGPAAVSSSAMTLIARATVAAYSTTAAQGASADAVSTLFAKPWSTNTYTFGGCSDSTECDYNYAAGVVAMTIDGNDTTGYTVSKVSFGSAG